MEVSQNKASAVEHSPTPPKYRTILADPPWRTNQEGNRGAIRHYPLMPTKAICDLRVDQLAAADAHLWLWAMNSNIAEGIAVMEAWGFSYRSCLTWVKYGRTTGLGVYLRNQTEQLLFGIRGSAPILFRSQATWFVAPRQEHSHKPEEQYAIIERCSPGPYLELFARRQQPGWHVWGNQISSDVEISRGGGSHG